MGGICDEEGNKTKNEGKPTEKKSFNGSYTKIEFENSLDINFPALFFPPDRRSFRGNKL